MNNYALQLQKQWKKGSFNTLCWKGNKKQIQKKIFKVEEKNRSEKWN